MVNAWVQHIKNYASKNGQTYGCALSDPKCRDAYKKESTKKQSTNEKKIKYEKLPKAEKWKLLNAGENAFSSHAELKRFLKGTMNKNERALQKRNDLKIEEYNQKLVKNNDPLPHLKKKKVALIDF